LAYYHFCGLCVVGNFSIKPLVRARSYLAALLRKPRANGVVSLMKLSKTIWIVLDTICENSAVEEKQGEKSDFSKKSDFFEPLKFGGIFGFFR